MMREATDTKTWRLARAECTLAWCLATMDRFDEAEALLAEAFPRLKQAYGQDTAERDWHAKRLAEAYEAADRPAQAQTWRSHAGEDS